MWKRLLKENEHHEVFVGLCKKEKIEGVKWCLNHTPNDNVMKAMIEDNDNKEQRFPLLWAIFHNKTNAISLVLIKEHKRLNADFLTTCDATGYNVLIYATYALDSGRLQVLKEVVDIYKNAKKLDLREKANGANAFMMASRFGHYDCVKFLIEYYKEASLLHEKSKYGMNALQYAKRFNHEEIVSLLQQYYE